MDTGILLGAFALVLALYQSGFGWANAPHFGPLVGAPGVLHSWSRKREEFMRTRLRLSFLLIATILAWPCLGQTSGQQPEDQTIAVFGQTIHYWDVGSGPVLVLLHGLGSGKAEDWGRVIAPLSHKYRVIALHQVGSGHSDKPLLDYRIQTYVDFLNEFLRQLKVQKASLMGESLGDRMAFRTNWWRKGLCPMSNTRRFATK
jgi:hypothetical protein